MRQLQIIRTAMVARHSTGKHCCSLARHGIALPWTRMNAKEYCIGGPLRCHRDAGIAATISRDNCGTHAPASSSLR